MLPGRFEDGRKKHSGVVPALFSCPVEKVYVNYARKQLRYVRVTVPKNSYDLGNVLKASRNTWAIASIYHSSHGYQMNKSKLMRLRYMKVQTKAYFC
jgi:hypothetical protein